MRRNLGGFAAAFALSLPLATPIAEAQKSGGVLIMSHFDSPASVSMHEEATGAVNRPMMGVFNNLVMYRQDVAQNSMASIVPDLATSWSWNEEGTELRLTLRQGVRWHDGKPFTARDVKCTWDLLTGRSADKLRLNPRKSWYSNLEEVTANGESEVTFRLKRPQPSFLALLASGWSPVYPATSRRATCGRIRSAPARSNLSNSGQTSGSGSLGTSSTGNRTGPISTASSGESSRAWRRASWDSSPAVSIRSSA